jgi:hypothetical protein
MWFDIRCAARQEQSIAGLQQGRKIDFRAERRHQHRYGVGALGDRLDVLLSDHVEIVLSKKATVGWNSDERQARHV